MKVETSDMNEVIDYLKRIPQANFDAAKKVFRDATLSAQTTITKNATNKLKRRSGNLARSIKTELTGNTLSTLKAGVYSTGVVGGEQVEYAPIHEYGGTIKAKKAYMRVPGGPYLNVPTNKNKTASGVTRYTAREIFSWEGTKIKKLKSGAWGVTNSGWIWFVLRKTTKIKPQLGMREACENEVPTILSRLQELIGWL